MPHDMPPPHIPKIEIPEHQTSYWIDSFVGESYPELTADLHVDVVIVGAGIAGLTTAYLLKKEGLRVAVIEKDTVGSGVSGYTTGKISSQHNLIYAKLIDRLGLEKASDYGEANQVAIRLIAQIIRDENIACDWRVEDNYVYTTDASKVEQFKEEAEAARACGLPATFVTKSDLPFTIAAAVKVSDQATFHVRKYLHGLAAKINGDGSFVFEHSKVVSINNGKPPRVSTKKAKIFANDIIVATNVPTFPLAARGSYALSEYPQQSYIIAGHVPENIQGMYISPDENHYSILPVKNNSDNLLFIGGEGHIPGTRLNPRTRYERLIRYGEKHFGMTDVVYQWTHRDYLGYDDMPLIGKLYPWSKHIYTATGFMKWGLTNGTVAAIILSDKLTGRKNPWVSTFDSQRLTPALSIPKVISEHLGLR